MANKKANWEDLFNNSPSWAVREREDFQNNDRKYNAIIDALEKESGTAIPEEVRRSMLGELRAGRQIEWKPDQAETSAPVLPSAARPNFSDVQGGVSSTEDNTLASTASTLGATLRDSLKNMGARALDQYERLPNVASTYDVLRQLTGADPAEVSGGIANDLRTSANDPLRIARTEQLRNRFESEGGIKGFVGAGAVDALSSPSSVLSLVGGPVGAAAVADAYAVAYEQGKQNNLSGEQLEAWALSQSAPELVSLIPAGKAVTKIPVLGPLIEKRLARAATGFVEKKIANPILAAGVNTAKAAVGEGVEEMFTGSLQDLAAAAFAGQTQAEDLQRMGQQAMPQDENGKFSLEQFGQNRYRDFRAAVVSAGATGPINLYQANRDANNQIADQRRRGIAAALSNEQTERASAPPVVTQEPAATLQPTQPDMFGTEEGLPSVEEYQAQRQKQNEQDAAYLLRDRQQAEEQKVKTREERRAELRDSINRRIDTERDQVETLRDRVEGGDTSSATLSTLAAAQRRLKVAENDLYNFDTNFQPQEPVAQEAPVTATPTDTVMPEPVQPDLLEGQRAIELSDAADRLKAAREKQAKEAAKAATASKAAETARRNRLAEQVAKEHADKTDTEQAQILADLIASPETQPKSSVTKEPTQEDKIQSVINQVEGLRKRQNTQRVNNRIRSLYKADPTRTAQDISNILNQQEGTAAPVESEVMSEDSIRATVAALNNNKGNLSMAEAPTAASAREQEATQTEGTAVVPRTAEQETAYRKKVTDFVSALPNTNEGVAILNLIKQGKLILTDKGQSVGRANTSDQGTYSPSKGKQYIELNNIDPTAPKAAILSQIVAHESAHAGQFNQRDGRSALFKHLLGDKGNAAANKQIRDLASSGNKLAQAAVNKATAAAKSNDSFTNVEDLELVPYLFSEAKSSNFSPGRVGKVVRDVKVAARELNRKLLNADLDFSIDEIAAAADKVAEEIVNTNTSRNNTDTAQADDLAMVMGQTATEAKAAVNKYVGSVDGLQRWLMSDAGATVAQEQAFPLVTGEKVKLGDLLQHSELYKNYPQLKDISVVVDNSMDGEGVAGYFDDRKEIRVSPQTANNLGSDVARNTLLHETQHAIQSIEGFSKGSSKQNYVSPFLRGDLDKANLAFDKMLSNFNLGVWTKTVPSDALTEYENSTKGMSHSDKVNWILANNKEALSTDRVVARYGEQYQKAKAVQNRAAASFNKDQQVAWDKYVRAYGEAEARTTEYLSRMEQAALDEVDFEKAFPLADEGVDVSETFDSDTGKKASPQRRDGELSMSAETTEVKAPKPKFAVKERINRILSHGRQDRLDVSKTAEDLHSQLVDAIEKDTGQPVLTAEMDNAFKEFLSHPDQKTPEGRARLIRDMSAKYPATTGVLTQVRDLISDITTDTIGEMINSGRPLTIDQRKSIATMLANKDTYMSRAYAAFQGAKGRKWAETRWSNFYKNIGKDVSSIKNDKVRADVTEVRDAIKTIVDGLRIPDENVLQDMPMDKLVSLAAKHNIKESQLQYDRNDPDATWMKRDELISELGKVKEAYPEGRLEDMAMDSAAELLGLGDRASAYAKQISQLSKDPGTLNKREHIPLEIRRLLGEIDVTPGAMLATLSNQAALRARAKVISELINDPNKDIAITQDDYYALPRATTKDKINPTSKTRDNYVQVSGEQWGALDGMYIRKEAFSRMEEAAKAFYTWGEAARLWNVDPKVILGKGVSAAARGAGAINRWTKIPTVVYNPVNYFAQYMGSYLNLVGAGNFSGSAWIGGKKAARDYILGTAKTITTPRLSEVMRHMNLESADIAEIQKILGTKLEDYFDGSRSLQDATLALNKHARGLLGRAHKTQLAFYATADNWSKIANFYHRYEVLSAANEAQGSPKTKEQVMQEAGDDTSYTNISPERANRLIQQAETAGVTQFAPYFAEVFRTRYTGFALAVKDLAEANRLYKDGHEKASNIMARAATSRLIGHMAATIGMPLVGTVKIASRLTALGVPAALAASIASKVTALGADDDDNKLKRRLLPESLRYQEILPIGKDSNNFPIFWGSSQKVDPSGPMTDILRLMAYADNDRTAARELENYAFDNLLIIPQIWKDVYRGIVGDNIPPSDVGKALDSVGMKSAFVEATGVGANTVDRYLNVLDNFIPGMLRAYKEQYSASDIQTDPSTKKAVEAFNKMGFRFETFNPSTTLQGYSRASEDSKKSNTSRINNDLLNIDNVTEKTVTAATENYFEREMKRQVEDYQNVKSLRAWGFNDEQIVALMKRGGYKEDYAKTLLEGNAAVRLSIKGLLQYADNSSKYLSSKENEVRRTRAGQVANMLIEMKPKLEELGIEVDESGIPKEWKE